jgi:ketopantoate reductase
MAQERRTQIDVLDVAIVRLGAVHGVGTACHATIVDLVTAREPS